MVFKQNTYMSGKKFCLNFPVHKVSTFFTKLSQSLDFVLSLKDAQRKFQHSSYLQKRKLILLSHLTTHRFIIPHMDLKILGSQPVPGSQIAQGMRK